MWSNFSKENGINLIPQKGSPIWAPFFLIFYFFKSQRKPFGYIVRYLNDYPNIFKTISRLLSEFFLICLCKVFNIKLIWICHNVDRESEAYFPLLSRTRRNLFASFSEKIFVTDQLLIEKAKKVFPSNQSKIDFVTFGVITNKSNQIINLHEKEILKLISTKRDLLINSRYDFKVLFCAGMPRSKKSLHFDYLLELIEKAKNNGIYLLAIVSGDFHNSERGEFLLSKFINNKQIFLFDNYTNFSEEFVKKAVDFYWRGYSDFSVPYSVFESATLKKPILALKNGFFNKYIEFYKLGLDIDLKTDNFIDIFDKLEQNDFLFDEFLVTHSWEVFAKKISRI